jgi:chromosome partitioning protein
MSEKFKIPNKLSSVGPASIISICNQKGGVGKTTTTVNLGAALAYYGRKVLIIDLDPQGAASIALNRKAKPDQKTIYNSLMGDVLIKDIVISTSIENLDIIPANIDLSASEVQLINEVARESVLARTIKPITNDYDVILIDSQPSLGLLTVNALTASKGVIIPLEAEYFAMRGAALLVDTIEKIAERLNPTLKIDGILVTMFDPRTLHSKEVLHNVKDGFKDKVFETVINRTIKFPDSTVAALSIIEFAPNHKGAKSYLQLAREIIQKGFAP